jgi:hypothetical protein
MSPYELEINPVVVLLDTANDWAGMPEFRLTRM